MRSRPADSRRRSRRRHAAASPVGGRSFAARLKLGSEVGNFGIGLAAPGKDLTKSSHIFHDNDVWLLSGDGYLYADGKLRASGASLAANDVLDLEYDAGAATLRFLRGGVVLGQHTGVARNPKIVVTMGSRGNGAEFI